MSSNHTLEELLCCALGTPEIGAVNFNYLFELLNEILKHLGITKQLSRSSAEETEFRVQVLSGRSTPLPNLQEEKSEGQILTIVDSQSSEKSGGSREQGERSERGDKSDQGDRSKRDEKSDRNDGGDKSDRSNRGDKSNRSERSDKSGRIDGEDKSERSERSDKSDRSDGGDKSDRGDKIDRSPEDENLPNAEKQGKSGPVSRREVAPVSPNPPMRGSSRRASNVSAGFSERRLSQFRNSIEGAGASNHDFILVNRSLDRRDSKTPAGDMCHVLNVNRRLEAVEATIQGMTNLIDGVSSDVIDLKDVFKTLEELKEASRKPSPVIIESETTIKTDDSNADFGVYNEQLVKLSKVVQDHESSIKKAAMKEDIREFCSTPVVEAMIEEKLASQSSSSRSVSSVSSVANAEQLPKRRGSRTKLYQEMINRIEQVEETGSVVNEELENIKSALDLKAGKQGEGEDFIGQLRNEIALLAKEIEKLQFGEKEVAAIKQKLEDISEESNNVKISSEYNSKEQGSIRRNVANFGKQLESLTDTVFTKLGNSVQQPTPQVDLGLVTKLRAQMNGLNEQHNLIEKEIHQTNKELNKTNEKLILLDEVTERLKATKIDKDYLTKMLSSKAEKSELRDKISQDQFDSGLGHLEHSLQDTLQRVDGQDTVLKQFFMKIDGRFEQKLDREVLHQLKEYIEKRLKSVKVKAPAPVLPEDAAAGFRKPLLRKFHCISCDRPLELPQDDVIPSLPVSQALPGARAMRPYTTFELEQIRKHMRGDGSNRDRFELAHERERLQKQLLRLCGAHDLDDFAARTARACGGSHTLLDPQKRGMIKATMISRDEMLPVEQPSEPIIEGDVMGQDGHIYKGRLEHLPPLKQTEVSKSMSQTEAPAPILARPSFHNMPEVSGTPLPAANTV